MPRELVEPLRRGHALFNRGDLEALADVMTEDVAWGTTGTYPGIDAVYRGPDGVIAWASDMRSAWDSFQVSLEEVIYDGDDDRAVVVEVIRGRGRQSGAEVEARAYCIYTFRDGRVASRRAFADRAAALAAAGLGG